MITIDHQKCTECEACLEVCPMLVLEKKNAKVEYIHKESCIRCYHCVAVCPVDAVFCDEFPLDAFKKFGKAKPATSSALDNLLSQRRSIREFKDKEVPRSLLEELVSITSHAPTGHNIQGIELTIITDRERINALETRISNIVSTLGSVINYTTPYDLINLFGGETPAKMLRGYLKSLKRFQEASKQGRYLVFKGAPVIVVAHTNLQSVTGKDDCLIALDQMMMSANARGLGATWIGMLVGAVFLDPTLKISLEVPSLNIVHAAIILGWPKYKYNRTIPRKCIPVKWVE